MLVGSPAFENKNHQICDFYLYQQRNLPERPHLLCLQPAEWALGPGLLPLSAQERPSPSWCDPLKPHLSAL